MEYTVRTGTGITDRSHLAAIFRHAGTMAASPGTYQRPPFDLDITDAAGSGDDNKSNTAWDRAFSASKPR